MVDKTLAAGGMWKAFEWLLEAARNILIFVPVLVAWLEIQSSGINNLGDLRGTAALVVGFIFALIGTHVFLVSVIKPIRARRADRIATDFAAALTNASMEASVHQGTSQADEMRASIERFAQTGRELAAGIQGAGDALGGAKEAMDRMAGSAEAQRQQMDELVRLMKPIADIGNELGATQREIAAAAVTMSATAESLSNIEKNIAPAAESLGSTVQDMRELSAHLDRMTVVFAEHFGPRDDSAQAFGEAVTQLNVVSNRVAGALDALQEARDGAGSRFSG